MQVVEEVSIDREQSMREDAKVEDINDREETERDLHNSLNSRLEEAETLKRSRIAFQPPTDQDEDATSDYNTNYGLSDDKFKEISSIMKTNSESSKNESEQKIRGDRDQYVIDDEDEQEDPSSNQDRFRMQFEIKSQIESLKRKIKKQQDENHSKHNEAKKAALDFILKKKKTEREAQQNVEPKEEPKMEPKVEPKVESKPDEGEKCHYYKHLISPSQKDSLQRFEQQDFQEIDDYDMPDVVDRGKLETAHFQRSTKFDTMPIAEPEPNDDIYEEDFEHEEIDDESENEPVDIGPVDALDKNMEIPIPNAPNNRYQQTFGGSSESYVEVSGMNPLEESEYTKFTPKKMNFNNTLDVEDEWTSYGQADSNSKGTESSYIKSQYNRDSDTCKDNDTGTNVFSYEDQGRNMPDIKPKDFQLSFRFENKELEDLNDESYVFDSKGNPQTFDRIN